jgi:hypothetical protein
MYNMEGGNLGNIQGKWFGEGKYPFTLLDTQKTLISIYKLSG